MFEQAGEEPRKRKRNLQQHQNSSSVFSRAREQNSVLLMVEIIIIKNGILKNTTNKNPAQRDELFP
ncbi:hypothetical protein [Paraclostridium dentum]|uniref:hypothetical protein n=1 Tax=Paraclostridium dentum TaxID=2662455 RepID=UPI003F3580BD